MRPLCLHQTIYQGRYQALVKHNDTFFQAAFFGGPCLKLDSGPNSIRADKYQNCWPLTTSDSNAQILLKFELSKKFVDWESSGARGSREGALKIGNPLEMEIF